MRRFGAVRHIFPFSVLLAAAILVPITPAEALGPPQADALTLRAAIESTLANHPGLGLQRQEVEIRTARVRQRGGQFDLRLTASAGYVRSVTALSSAQESVAGYDRVTSQATFYRGGAGKLLRSGVFLGPRLDVTRTLDDTGFDTGLNRARFSFDIVVPFLRDAGRDNVAAAETAAAIEVEASRLDLSHRTAQLVVATTVSYWQYLAAVQGLQVLRGSERRGQEFSDNVATLIAADRLPRSEINLAEANLAARVGQRLIGEQQLIEARQALALAMGLDPDRLFGLAPPYDDFADWRAHGVPDDSSESIRRYAKIATSQRADLLAAAQREHEVGALVAAAINQTRSQLDLTFSPGFSSLGEGTGYDLLLTSPLSRVEGPDVAISLTFSRSPANNLAAGNLAESRAVREQAALVSAQLARTITTEVINGVEAVRLARERLEAAERAVTLFEAALQGERDKLSLAVGDAVSLLSVEDRLTGAMLALVQARLGYAASISTLRFATGTLVSGAADRPVIDLDAILAPPFVSSAREPRR